MSDDLLQTLGIDEVCQWDVLVFLHRHRDALLGVDHIAGLLGHEKGAIASALDHLESVGLVERSRLSHGVRQYHFNRLSGPRGRAFEELFESDGSRAGRLALFKKLLATGKTIPGSNGPLALTDGPQSKGSKPNRAAVRGRRLTDAAKQRKGADH